jgi:hypothetical protein
MKEAQEKNKTKKEEEGLLVFTLKRLMVRLLSV